MNLSKNNDIIKTSLDPSGILRICLNNPNNHNALSNEMMNKILSELNEASVDKKIRVVIISAEGPTFSAGHDLKELKSSRKNSDKCLTKFRKYLTPLVNFDEIYASIFTNWRKIPEKQKLQQ